VEFPLALVVATNLVLWFVSVEILCVLTERLLHALGVEWRAI
jgi:hypothetical protein